MTNRKKARIVRKVKAMSDCYWDNYSLYECSKMEWGGTIDTAALHEIDLIARRANKLEARLKCKIDVQDNKIYD